MNFNAACGGSLYDPNPLIQEELWVAVIEERTPVNVDYLVRRCRVSPQVAYDSLARFVDACEGDLQVTYMVTGVDPRHGPVSVMTQNVYSVAKNLDAEPRVQVYGVGPKLAASGEVDCMMITDEAESTDAAPVFPAVARGRKRALASVDDEACEAAPAHDPVPHVAAKRRCMRVQPGQNHHQNPHQGAPPQAMMPSFPFHSPPLQQPQHQLPAQAWGSVCGGR